MTTGRCLLIALALLLAASAEAFAQSSVESRVQRLEETIRTLESRVALVEAQLHDRPAPASVASDRLYWRKLNRGMSQGDVEQLLGSPSKVDANQIVITWYYDYPTGGRVQFDADSRKVEGWTEP